MSGPHVQPDLGGTLQEVVEMAVEMPGFYTWGAGGDIRRVEVKKAGGNMVVKKANGGYACIKVNEL